MQAAWAASHTQNTYLASQYRRLAGRSGRTRALVAVAHSMLVIFYHMLKTGARYSGLGGGFFEALGSKQDHLGAHDLKIWQRILCGSLPQLAFFGRG